MAMINHKEGYVFGFDSSACSMCKGSCCTGESGYIWVTIDEIEAISNHLDMPISKMIKDYAYRHNGRFSLQEVQVSKNNYSCVFFDGKCTIYDVRPSQCKTFPFWPRFKKKPSEVFKECPGVRRYEQSDS
jgi:uncharacterized protein